MYNYHVFDNDVAFKVINQPLKVVFGSGSKLQKDDKLTNTPLHEFCFRDFTEIQDRNFKTDVLHGTFFMYFKLFHSNLKFYSCSV